MNKRLKKFITILILFVMFFQIMLPTCFALTREEFEATRFEKNGEVYYEYDGTTYKAVYPSRSGWFIQTGFALIGHLPFYFDKSGDMLNPPIETTSDVPEMYYLKSDMVYYVAKGMDIQYYEPDKTVLEEFEAMLADFVFSIASGLHYLVGAALGEALTIDDLVFNNYEETNISFFEDGATGRSKLIYGDGNIKGLNDIIPDWYNMFMKIALMGYMVILVYMGIKILMTSTAEKKADYKKLFIDWIIGLAILLLFPYAMKYMIKANDAIVETIEANKGYSDTVAGELANEDLNYDKDPAVVDEEIRWETGTDYMSKMATAAEQNRRLALSFAFLIMTWQLITLIFHYYKRLFMIAFLIVIFPLVAFSYAIDKIADGKSQAFNTWAKEFMLNVFVQSFHAIVYVFVCTTVYSASGLDGSLGFDYILIIVGVTFLFSGEEIIRQIFGQVSSAGTMGSLSDTAAASFAKFTAVKGVVSGIGSYTIGEKSVPRKLIKGSRRIGAINARIDAFDKTATTAEDYNKGARLEHYNDTPDDSAPEEQKEYFFNNREKYFNAAAVFNNPNSHSYEEKAKALETLKELASMNPEKDDVGLKKLKAGVFKDLKANAAQIMAISAIDRDVQHMMNAGMSRIDIEREVTARLGVIFPSETKEQIKDRTNTYFTGMYLKGASNTVTINRVNEEIKEILEEVDDIQKSIVFADSEHALTDEEREEIIKEVVTETEEICEAYENLEGGTHGVTKEYARNIAILMQRGSGVYTESDILAAASYLRDHSHDNEAITQMLEEDFGMDVDMFMHALARKVTDEPEDTSRGADYQAARTKAQSIVDDYENNAREGYFDDEISVHQVMKVKHNSDEIDKIMEENDEIRKIAEEAYENRKKVMEEATEQLAHGYLVDNQISITENSHDTEVRTQDGYTYEELLVMKAQAKGKLLKDLAAVNKSSASGDSLGSIDLILKKYLDDKDAERTGITTRIKEEKTLWGKTKDVIELANSGSAIDYVEERRKKREKIDEEHFYGDIGDRK